MQKGMGRFTMMTLALMGLVVAGCEQAPEKGAPRATDAGKQAAAVLPADLFVQEAPVGARAVADLKADTELPAEVVVHGRIGGRRKPFVDGAAVFLLADISLKPCNELHGDSCPTPWDYCCEPHDSLMAGTATIQIVDADGKPLHIDLNGQQGLVPSAEITVVGDVAQHEEGGALVINARKIHLKTSAG